MESRFELEKVYRDFLSGRISETQAVWKIFEIFVSSRCYFGLNYDDAMNFFMMNFNRVCRIINQCDVSRGKFATFLIFSLKKELRSWRKLKDSRHQNEATVLCSFREEMKNADEIVFDYDEMALAEPIPLYESTALVIGEVSRRDLNIAQKAALAVALKACHYISEEQIAYIAHFSGIDEYELREKIVILNDSLSRRLKNREKNVATRDNSYFFHRKYAIALQKIKNGDVHVDSFRVQFLRRRYENCTRLWIEKNALLRAERKLKIAPTNHVIAEIMGVNTRQVTALLHQALRRHIIERVLNIPYSEE